MSTITRIRRFISSIRRKQLFSTRDCLSFGTRGAVDQALYSLVKNGVIIRVVRGVFRRKDSKPPSVFLVAKVKAESFGKRILQHGIDAANAIGFPVEANQSPTFATTGRSSSFRFGNLLIRFVGSSPRKLLKHSSGQVVRAMWALGKEKCTCDLIARTYPIWGKACRKIEAHASLLPAWMNNLFHWGKKDQRVSKNSKLMAPLSPDLTELFPDLADLFRDIDRRNFLDT